MNGQIHQHLTEGSWAEVNPNNCPCNGGGWSYTDRDVYYRCPVHHIGQPHPEMDGYMTGGDTPTVDYRRQVQIAAFRTLRNLIAEHLDLTETETNTKIGKTLAADERDPSDWVDAADRMWLDLHQKALEAAAIKAGYSCRLEAAWTTQGEAEYDARAHGHSPHEAEQRGFHASQEWY